MVVPVVGPDLSRVERGGKILRLTEHVAAHLVRELGLTGLAEDAPLARVVALCLAQHHDPADLRHEVHQAVKEARWAIPTPLRQLAEILDFDLFLSTGFDDLLERALNEVRFGGAERSKAIAYSNHSRVDDLPKGDTIAVPTVFQVFGRTSVALDFALTEEDVLEFAHHLQDPGHQPPNLFDHLRQRHFLVLGCNLPDWLARFLLRCTKGERFASSREVFADERALEDHSFVSFLERRRADLYREGDAATFVAELHRRWKERYGNARIAPPSPANAPVPSFKAEFVFLSYAREDLDAARRIAQALNQAGVDVWQDERSLEPGDEFKSKILRSIEAATFFVPLLSRHTAFPGPRFFRLEWNAALEVAPMHPPGFPFLQPLVLDATSPQDELIPAGFRRVEIKTLKDGELPPSFVEGIVRRLRERRRQRTGTEG